MGFIKSGQDAGHIRVFDSFEEAQAVLEDSTAPLDRRLEAMDYMVRHQEIYYLLDVMSAIFSENRVEEHPLIDFAFSQFTHKPKREKDFEAMFHLLKSDNAYLRNAVITFLQFYRDEVRHFLERLLHDDDRDVRIFAINILGDVRLEDAVCLLREAIDHELNGDRDVNVVMTAVDYLGELGDSKDVARLERVKQTFADDPYVQFGVDMALERIRGSQ